MTTEYGNIVILLYIYKIDDNIVRCIYIYIFIYLMYDDRCSFLASDSPTAFFAPGSTTIVEDDGPCRFQHQGCEKINAIAFQKPDEGK